MSHTQRVMHLNAALEEADVGELPSRDAQPSYDALHLRPDRPLSQPAGNNIDFKRMFSKGLMVLRAEHVGADSSPDASAGDCGSADDAPSRRGLGSGSGGNSPGADVGVGGTPADTMGAPGDPQLAGA